MSWRIHILFDSGLLRETLVLFRSDGFTHALSGVNLKAGIFTIDQRHLEFVRGNVMVINLLKSNHGCEE